MGSARQCPDDRAHLEPLARRSSWRRQLLSRLPPRAARRKRRQGLPRRIMPGDGRGRARRTYQAAPQVRFRRRPAPTARLRSSRSTASAIAPARRPSWSTANCSAASRRSVSTMRWRELDGRPMSTTRLCSARFERRLAGRGRGRRRDRGRGARGAASSSRIVRNGSRGLYWLEPMVEVETARGRVAYGPVAADGCRIAVRRRISSPAESIGCASVRPTRFRISRIRSG